MLADLVLEEMPYEILIVLRKAVNAEITRREVSMRTQARKLTSELQFPSEDINESVENNEGTIDADVQEIGLFPLPDGVRQARIQKRLSYLPYVLAQDWTSCFATAPDDRPDFYVYAHVDPSHDALELPGLKRTIKGLPFYIGKGSGSRGWNLKRNEGHGKRLRALRSLGHEPSEIVQILADQLTEKQALCLEAKLIYFFGSLYDTMTKGCLVNLADHMRPTFTPMPPKHPRRGKGNIPPRDHDVRIAWKKYKNNNITKKYLPEDMRSNGFTILQVHPIVREAFLAIVILFRYRSKFGAKQSLPVDLQRTWDTWLALTNELNVSLSRYCTL